MGLKVKCPWQLITATLLSFQGLMAPLLNSLTSGIIPFAQVTEIQTSSHHAQRWTSYAICDSVRCRVFMFALRGVDGIRTRDPVL